MKSKSLSLVLLLGLFSSSLSPAQFGRRKPADPNTQFTTGGVVDDNTIIPHQIKSKGTVSFPNPPQLILPINTQFQVKEVADGTDSVIRLSIACGSEKVDWMREALAAWSATNPKVRGKNVAIIIEPKGSVEGGRIVREGNNQGYTVWAPASSVVRKYAENAFRGGLFQNDQSLFSSPLVFLTYEDFNTEIIKLLTTSGQAKRMSFNAVVEVLDKERIGSVYMDPSGNNDLFKFGMTDPLKSGSGLASLVMMTYEYFSIRGSSNFRNITERELKDPHFQNYLGFQKMFYDNNVNSTGTLAKRLASRPPRQLHSALVYESDAIAAIEALRLRKDSRKLAVNYPIYSQVQDHPYYIIKHNTSSEQREAAEQFLQYLTGKEMQLIAMTKYGFRPSSNDITEQELESTFGHYATNGVTLKPGVSKIIPAQDGRTIEAMFKLWETISYDSTN